MKELNEKLKNILVSYSMAIKLKKKGFPQEATIFGYTNINDEIHVYTKEACGKLGILNEFVAAPTIVEIMNTIEMEEDIDCGEFENTVTNLMALAWLEEEGSNE